MIDAERKAPSRNTGLLHQIAFEMASDDFKKGGLTTPIGHP